MFTQRDRLTWGHPPVRVRPASLRLLTLSIKWPRSFSLCSLILHQVSLTPLIFSVCTFLAVSSPFRLFWESLGQQGRLLTRLMLLSPQ